jgi:hypothetical protein
LDARTPLQAFPIEKAEKEPCQNKYLSSYKAIAVSFGDRANHVGALGIKNSTMHMKYCLTNSDDVSLRTGKCRRDIIASGI